MEIVLAYAQGPAKTVAKDGTKTGSAAGDSPEFLDVLGGKFIGRDHDHGTEIHGKGLAPCPADIRALARSLRRHGVEKQKADYIASNIYYYRDLSNETWSSDRPKLGAALAIWEDICACGVSEDRNIVNHVGSLMTDGAYWLDLARKVYKLILGGMEPNEAGDKIYSLRTVIKKVSRIPKHDHEQPFEPFKPRTWEEGYDPSWVHESAQPMMLNSMKPGEKMIQPEEMKISRHNSADQAYKGFNLVFAMFTENSQNGRGVKPVDAMIGNMKGLLEVLLEQEYEQDPIEISGDSAEKIMEQFAQNIIMS